MSISYDSVASYEKTRGEGEGSISFGYNSSSASVLKRGGEESHPIFDVGYNYTEGTAKRQQEEGVKRFVKSLWGVSVAVALLYTVFTFSRDPSTSYATSFLQRENTAVENAERQNILNSVVELHSPAQTGRKPRVQDSISSADQINPIPGIAIADHIIVINEKSLENEEKTSKQDISHSVQMVQRPLHEAKPAPKDCSSAKKDSGFIKIRNKVDQHYFYWMYESCDRPEEDPVVLWLSGGPGASSIYALLSENGPISLDSKGNSHPTQFAWNRRANVIWVDQPTGTGYSYGAKEDYDISEDGVARDMYSFLQQWLQQYPKFANHKFFIFGESYGAVLIKSFSGHYVPSISHRVIFGNKNLLPGDLPINLQGIGIGNGLTNPLVQYQFMAQLAVENDFSKRLVSQDSYQEMDSDTTWCVGLIARCQIDKKGCVGARSYCTLKLMNPVISQSQVNPYDMRKTCDPTLRPEQYFDCVDPAMGYMKIYMNKNSTRKMLRIPSDVKQWEPINYQVNELMAPDWMTRNDHDVEALLQKNIRVLIYAGNADLQCNWLGNKAWTQQLRWRHQEEYNKAKDFPWFVEDRKAGEVRTFDKLTFMKIYDAGHMVPHDQPEASLAMLNRFLDNEPFVDTVISEETATSP